MREPAVLSFTKPAILLGALSALFGAGLFAGVMAIENAAAWGIVALCLGFGLVIFGVMTQALWRVVTAAGEHNNDIPSEDAK
ncbi:hypothetical protein L5876_03255 [Hyphobacterium sp. SN044]|uniref:hypothetical protein n=1 Tax=Hyphobacterium sp. SN044 TaxID=2912575 RepID=UPI001F275171|nr:hypothetical protein [Hyphobacterium sp. SN044]MCF8878829.1 hypothetical protein [Hyphobacterium sp. SN044]